MLNRVILMGLFQRQETVVIWRRRERHWAVSMKWGAKERKRQIDLRTMPCWTVSMRLLKENFSKAKPYVRQYAKRIAKEQGLRIVR